MRVINVFGDVSRGRQCVFIISCHVINARVSRKLKQMYKNALDNSDIPNAESIVVNNLPTAACWSVNQNDTTAVIEGCRLGDVLHHLHVSPLKLTQTKSNWNVYAINWINPVRKFLDIFKFSSDTNCFPNQYPWSYWCVTYSDKPDLIAGLLILQYFKYWDREGDQYIWLHFLRNTRRLRRLYIAPMKFFTIHDGVSLSKNSIWLRWISL